MDLNISLLYRIIDILEDYFPEGSDVYHHGFINKDGHVMGTIEGPFSPVYYWLPPTFYPTYMACFIAREKPLKLDVSDVYLFKCEDGSVIADMLVCNGRYDCKNSEDEQHCPILCSWADSIL